MALNKGELQGAIQTAFDTAKEEEWSTAQVAEALANAIDAFVRGAHVVDVTTKVTVSTQNNHTHTGTGTQTGVGRLE